MSQVSRPWPTGEIKERIGEVFCQALTNIKTQKQAEEFFETFFTATEKVNLPKRLGIFLLLAKGDGYDEIRDKLRVSKPTIASVQKQIHIHGLQGVEKTINKVIAENKPNIEVNPNPLLGSYNRVISRKAIQRPYKNLPY